MGAVSKVERGVPGPVRASIYSGAVIGPAVDGARLRRNPAATGSWVLALGVFLLCLGVVAMHVLGSGHHPMAGAAPSGGAGHASHSGATGSVTAAGLDPTSVGPVVAMASMLAPATTDRAPACPGCDPVSVEGSAVGHALMTVCLAVIPLVLVLLRPWRRAWFLSREAVGWQRPDVADAAWVLARVDSRRPSLAELCILRT